MPAVIVRAGEKVLIKASDNNVNAVLKRMQAKLTNFDLSAGNTLYLTDGTGNVLSLAEIA
jgi:hypothetical protein